MDLNVERFRNKLNEDTVWPSPYMFKFIVPNQNGKVEVVKSILSPLGELSYKHTSNLKFVSVTCVAEMPGADAVIDITIQVTAIKGVMAL